MRVDPVGAATRIEVPVPFAIGTVNAWAFGGQQPTLVDCGIGTPKGYESVREGLRTAGVPERGLRLLLTHGHVDHAGNARRLRDELDATLHAPREESRFVETFRRDSGPRNDAFADALRCHGMPTGHVRRLRGQSDRIDSHLEDTAIDADLRDQERLVLGDADAVALRTPGHTPGSTCYHLPDTNQVLTGDTLLQQITSNAIELLDEDHGAFWRYRRSVESMRRFTGCQALPGHHEPFEITDAVIDRHTERHEKRSRKVLQALDRRRTAWDLMPVIFPTLSQDAQWFMAMAEIVGHLHALEIDGRVRRSEEDGVRRFQAV